MGEYLLINYAEVAAMLLFVIGFSNLLLQKNLIKKIIGLNIMDTAIYLFLALKGYVTGGIPPIIMEGASETQVYVNPVPSGLVLTGIVVGVSVTALMLGITIRMYVRYHTLDLDEISMLMKKGGE
ncbi:MAG: cation:proton antiporter subunit C [Eubacteriales bacterium]